MNEDKWKTYIETYLNDNDSSSSYIDGWYNFFDIVPSEIESIKIVDNTKYFDLKAYDNSENEIEYRTDRLGRINQTKHIRNGAWFPYFHNINNLDLSEYQILSNAQLDKNINTDIFLDHCFFSCLKYYKII
jgi:hypothetical protein